MTNRQLVMSEIAKVPDPLLDKVLEYIRRLISQPQAERANLAAASETTLQKDWLRPEEERAWQSL